MRFTAPEGHAEHFDWHYHQNRAKKDARRKIPPRRWCCSETDWIELQETVDQEEGAEIPFFENTHPEAVLKAEKA
ncbi:Pre-mRNA cleavage complex 2 protein Pcf11, partial [Merops nubicus]